MEAHALRLSGPTLGARGRPGLTLIGLLLLWGVHTPAAFALRDVICTGDCNCDRAASVAQPVKTCTGDCDRNSAVTIDELITGVGLALNGTAVSFVSCQAFDANADGRVAIDELISAVTHALSGCPSATPTTTPTATPSVTETSTPDLSFYEPPEPLPGNSPGDLIRFESIEPLAPGSRAWRILYRSESVAGEPIAVSGLVVAPEEPPPAGGRPVVSWAHGTVGISDGCAPSRGFRVPLNDSFTHDIYAIAPEIVAA